MKQGFSFVDFMFLLLMFGACSNRPGTPTVALTPTINPNLDSATGLPLNPDPIPAGSFIVEGTIVSMTLLHDTPEFLVRVPSGKTYRLRTQPLSETYYSTGELIEPTGIRQGMGARATVQIDDDTSLLISDNLIITP